MRCGNLIFVAVLAATAASHAQVNPIPLGTEAEKIRFHYAPEGRWWIEHPLDSNPDSAIPPMTTLELAASEEFFAGNKGPSFGLFDVYNTKKFFNLDPGGFTSLAGNEAVADLSVEHVSSILTVNGSFFGGGNLANDFIIFVPEPATQLLAIVGCLALVWYCRCVS